MKMNFKKVKRKTKLTIITTIKLDLKGINELKMTKMMKNSLENPLNKWYSWLLEANHSELIKSYVKALSCNLKNIKQITKKLKNSINFLKMKKMSHLRSYIV